MLAVNSSRSPISFASRPPNLDFPSLVLAAQRIGVSDLECPTSNYVFGNQFAANASFWIPNRGNGLISSLCGRLVSRKMEMWQNSFQKRDWGKHRDGFQKRDCGAVPIGEATEKRMNLVDFPQTVIEREV